MERVVEPGEFEIMTGPNSVDLKSATLTVVP
jgi:beta-glucosidase